MTVTFQARQSEDGSKGTWRTFMAGERRYVILTCPGCGQGATLQSGDPSHDHAIAADGSVTPSVECPHVGCSFHQNVRLEGWGG